MPPLACAAIAGASAEARLGLEIAPDQKVALAPWEMSGPCPCRILRPIAASPIVPVT